MTPASLPEAKATTQTGADGPGDGPRRGSRETKAPLAGIFGSKIACSLQPDLVGGRIDDWNRVLAKVKSRESISNGLRGDVDLVELAELVDAEQSCCSFFTIGIGVTADRVWLRHRTRRCPNCDQRLVRSRRMSGKLKATLVGLACLICYLPSSSPSRAPPPVSPAPPASGWADTTWQSSAHSASLP